MMSLGVLNMIMVVVKSSYKASGGEVEPEEEVEGMPNLGQGLPSFLILNSPNLWIT